jgi:site-specific recombinase XerD
MPPSLSAPQGARKPKLLEQVRDAIRVRHYSIRTEQAYLDWIKRFILFHDKRHPREMSETEVTQFLTHLARDGNVAASTQNQALSALLFLYKEVLKQEIGWLGKVERAKRPPKLPVVLSRGEVRRVYGHLHGLERLMASLLYGSGLRLMECVRLRGKGCRFCLRSNHSARWQRRERSRDDVAGESCRVAKTTSRQSKDATRTRCEGRVW